MHSLSNRLRRKSQNHNQTRKERKKTTEIGNSFIRTFWTVFRPFVCNCKTINTFGSLQFSGLSRPLFMLCRIHGSLFIHRRLCFANCSPKKRVLESFASFWSFKWRNPHFMIDNTKKRLECKKETPKQKKKQQSSGKWLPILARAHYIYQYNGQWFFRNGK